MQNKMSHSSATMNKESSKVTGKNLDSNQSRDDCPTFSSNLSETWLVVGPFLCLTLMSKAAQTNTLNIIDHFSFATVNICLIKLFFFCPHQSQQQQQPPIVISRALRWSNQSIFQSLFHFFILTRTYKVEKLSEDLFKTRLVHFFRAVSLASLFSVLILLGAIVITIIISEARFYDPLRVLRPCLLKLCCSS